MEKDVNKDMIEFTLDERLEFFHANETEIFDDDGKVFRGISTPHHFIEETRKLVYSLENETAALRKVVERLIKDLQEENRLKQSFINERDACNEAANKFYEEARSLKAELTTLRSEKGEGLANVLPTDGEIRMEALNYGEGEVGPFIEGAKWMRDRLQNQSPEKSPTDGGESRHSVNEKAAYFHCEVGDAINEELRCKTQCENCANNASFIDPTDLPPEKSPTDGGWIDANKELPPYGELVLCITDNGRFVAHREKGEKSDRYVLNWSDAFIWRIDAWMPLPPPPARQQ